MDAWSSLSSSSSDDSDIEEMILDDNVDNLVLLLLGNVVFQKKCL